LATDPHGPTQTGTGFQIQSFKFRISNFIRGVSPAAGLKSGQFDRKRKLNGINLQFSDRINQTSLKSFAPAGWMDRIVTLKQKNPDNPVNPV
jgi:hypothetical protein